MVSAKEVSSAVLFVKLLAQHISNQNTHDQFYTLWKNLNKEIKSETTISLFAGLVSSFHVIYPPQTTEIISAESSVPTKLTLLCGGSSNLLEQKAAVKQAHRNKYDWFRSSRLLADLLEASFPDEVNPGITIGHYLKEMFPEDIREMEETGLRRFLPTATVTSGSQLHQLMTEIGEVAVANFEAGSIKKQCLSTIIHGILNPGLTIELPPEITIEDVVETAMEAPTEIAIAWLRDCLSELDNEDGSPSISDYSLELILSRIKAINEENPCFIFVSTMLLSTLLDNYKYTSTIFETSDNIRKIASQYSRIRQERYCGVSLLDYFVAYDFFELLCNDNHKYNDLTFMLSRGQYDFGELFLGPEEYRDILDDYKEKDELYLAVFKKAVEEGLPELGNSLLSLYLFGRSVFLKGRIPLGNGLSNAIQIGLSLPGHKTLKHTISVILKESEKAYPSDPLATFSRRHLKQYLPNQAEIHVIQGGRAGKQLGATQKEIEDFFCAQLTESRWLKLLNESRGNLISSEISWRKTYEEFGWGMTDFSGMVIPCCKVIEIELVNRLSTFFYSDCYRTWVSMTLKKDPPKEPTAGWLVQMLRHYPRFSPGLKEMMDQLPASVHLNDKLLDNLQKVVNLRNKAAHKDQFGMDNFTLFRKLLFQDRILHDFIDCLL